MLGIVLEPLIKFQKKLFESYQCYKKIIDCINVQSLKSERCQVPSLAVSLYRLADY